MKLTKNNLRALIKGKGDCRHVLCGNSDCNKCILGLKPFSACYKLAIDTYIKRYGEAGLFEELL